MLPKKKKQLQMEQYSIEVCYSPDLFPLYENKEAVVVVVDILRATSSICTAFENGAHAIIPVKTRREAMNAKENGSIVAAERNGLILDFADFGNSPSNFTKENVLGKEIVYSTTNGTKTVQMAEECKAVAIGSFCNFTVLLQWLIAQKSPITILCAGWKGKYNIEDSVFAGALTDALLATQQYTTMCDSAIAAVDMWNTHKHNLRALINKCAQHERLRSNNLDDCIDYCLTFDTCSKVPVYVAGKIVPAKIN